MRKAVQLMLALASGSAAFLGANAGLASAPAMEEYRLKAAFVASFAGFVEWPADALRKPRDPIVICVLGENPFGPALDQAVNGKSIADRKLAVRSIADVRLAAGCQILFICASERKHFRSILKEPQLSGVLTIGDSDNFTSEGGVIDLQVEGDKIRIVINVRAAEQSGLRISSRLLSLARIVNK